MSGVIMIAVSRVRRPTTAIILGDLGISRNGQIYQITQNSWLFQIYTILPTL